MADRALKDIEREDFIKKLVDNGVFCLPPGGVTHDLGVAAFGMTSYEVVRRQMFRRRGGNSVASRPAGARLWTTTEDIHEWVRDEAEPQLPNPNKARNGSTQCNDQTSSDAE